MFFLFSEHRIVASQNVKKTKHYEIPYSPPTPKNSQRSEHSTANCGVVQKGVVQMGRCVMELHHSVTVKYRSKNTAEPTVIPSAVP